MKHLCECGCGGEVIWNKRWKRWNKYINHHHRKGEKATEEVRKKISDGKKGQVPWMKGRKHSDESKQKMSDANKGKAPWCKGKRMSMELRQKLSDVHKGQVPWNKGKKASIKTREKLSDSLRGKIPWNKGLKQTEEHKMKAAIGRMRCRSGESGYCEQWFDEEYKNDCRSDFCENCGGSKYDMNLVLHHADLDKMNCHPDNLQTLCRSCHATLHLTLRRAENWSP